MGLRGADRGARSDRGAGLRREPTATHRRGRFPAAGPRNGSSTRAKGCLRARTRRPRLAHGAWRRPAPRVGRSPLVRLLAPGNQFRDQGGAFALALPPGYRPGGRVYMLYTREDGRVHLDEFRPGPRGRPGRPRTLLSVPRHSRVDVGGDAAFGPDGLLYASFGFGARPDASQDPARLNGKIVRLDPLARVPRPELFASGLRVPWRLSFDAPRRRLIVADVGEAAFEEVNVLPLRARAPANLGWPFFEGRRRRVPGGPAGMVAPSLALRHGPRDVRDRRRARGAYAGTARAPRALPLRRCVLGRPAIGPSHGRGSRGRSLGAHGCALSRVVRARRWWAHLRRQPQRACLPGRVMYPAPQWPPQSTTSASSTASPGRVRRPSARSPRS